MHTRCLTGRGFQTVPRPAGIHPWRWVFPERWKQSRGCSTEHYEPTVVKRALCDKCRNTIPGLSAAVGFPARRGRLLEPLGVLFCFEFLSAGMPGSSFIFHFQKDGGRGSFHSLMLKIYQKGNAAGCPLNATVPGCHGFRENAGEFSSPG